MSGSVVPGRVRRWRDAWQGDDPAAVAALYHEGARHESAKVDTAFPRLGRTHLVGPAELRRYKQPAIERLGRQYFDITAVVGDDRHAVVEYQARSDRRPEPQRVVEWMEWDGDRMTACRVYHF